MAYVINLDKYFDIGTHWIALYALNNNITYLTVLMWNIFQKKTKNLLENLQLTNIFRIQAYDSVMHVYFCIGFIGFMHKGKRLTDLSNVFSPNNFKKNDDIILKYFKNEWMKFIWST